MPWIVENPDGSITEIVPNQIVRVTMPPEPAQVQPKRGIRGRQKMTPAQEGPQVIQWNANAILTWSEDEKKKFGISFVDVIPVPAGFVEIGYDITKGEDGTYSHKWRLVPIGAEDRKKPLLDKAKIIRDSLSRNYEYRVDESAQPLIVQTDEASLAKLHSRAVNFLIQKEGTTDWTMADNQVFTLSRVTFLDMVAKIDDHLDKVHRRYQLARSKIQSGEIITQDAVLNEMTNDG